MQEPKITLATTKETITKQHNSSTVAVEEADAVKVAEVVEVG